MSNIKDTKLYIKMYSKFHVAIYITMNNNVHNKSYQLKLDDINYHVYCYIKFGVNFKYII